MLAAGVGKRLRPLTLITPKPLVPLSSRESSLLRLVNNLRRLLDKDERIFVVLGYCSEPYYRYLRYRRDIVLIKDDELRGTAGQVKKVLEKHGENLNDVLLLNGDIYISERCLSEIVSRARSSEEEVTMFLLRRKFKYGVVELVNGSFRWIEKPSFLTVTGIYKMRAEILRKILYEMSRDRVDMNEVVGKMRDVGVRIGLTCLDCGEDELVDIGTILDFVKSLSLLNEDDIYDPSTRC
ncbi:MAG: NTP transferase domain-containing protein [Crenarchaeota archaeon]|nr:NTP transferase domain-containing protein [Thermoproteota archaeon]